jgi:hypothetical protein
MEKKGDRGLVSVKIFVHSSATSHPRREQWSLFRSLKLAKFVVCRTLSSPLRHFSSMLFFTSLVFLVRSMVSQTGGCT